MALFHSGMLHVKGRVVIGPPKPKNKNYYIYKILKKNYDFFTLKEIL